MLVPSIALCSWVGFVHWTEPSDSGPTTPLPNKKLLVFILDRLQKWVAVLAALFFLTFSSSNLSSRTPHLCVSLFLAGRTLLVYSQSLLILKRFVSALKDGDAICLACWFWFRTWLFCLFISIYGQLPDYHDIIKHPMDFSTIRKKLDKGAYSNLEQFEVGYRICLGCLCFLLFGFFFNKIACACLVITTTKLLHLCSEMLWLT